MVGHSHPNPTPERCRRRGFQKLTVSVRLQLNHSCSGCFPPHRPQGGSNGTVPNSKTNLDKWQKGEIYALSSVFSNTMFCFYKRILGWIRTDWSVWQVHIWFPQLGWDWSELGQMFCLKITEHGDSVSVSVYFLYLEEPFVPEDKCGPGEKLQDSQCVCIQRESCL